MSRLFEAYAWIIGTVSTLFMFYVFVNEALLHHGVTFIEPNLAIASLELVMSLAGLALCFLYMCRSVYRQPTAAELAAAIRALDVKADYLERLENDVIDAVGIHIQAAEEPGGVYA